MAIQINGTSGISGVDGSAATPALQGTDSNTGISFGTDTVSINTGGTARATVDSNGRLGVGTTSPGEPLSVATSSPGASATLARLQNTGTTSGTEARLLLSTSTSTGGTVSSGISCIATDAVGNTALALGSGTAGSYSEKARIDSSGRLLVGTTSSAGTQLLKINGTTGGSTNGGVISLTQGRTAPPDGSTHGVLYFGSETRPAGGASISSYANGAWTDGGSHPSGLILSTTRVNEVSPTERMRINSAGSVLINTTVNDARLFVTEDGTNQTPFKVNASSTNFSASTVALLTCNRETTNSSWNFLRCMHSGATDKCFIRDSGTIQNATGTYNTASDIKLKENIVDAPSQWDDIKDIRIRNFNFKVETGHETHKQIGVVAQELELVCPGLVEEAPDLDADGNNLGTTTKGVKSSILYMKAVKALQEAMERIESLEARLTTLEGGTN